MVNSPFKGYLLKAIDTDTILSGEYIETTTWKSTPNQREEIKAWRDDNTRDLTRITAKGKKSIFSFSTVAGMNLEQKMAFQKFFTDAEDNAEERKIHLQYWNDEDNTYKTGYFYRPNMEFTIQEYTDDDIIYDTMNFDFVEY
jgi:hypothetical protein